MNIVLTGATSFTGYHFVNELAKKNKVILPLNRKKIFYKKKRDLLILNNFRSNKNIKLKFDCKFCGKKFFKFLKRENFEIFCFHHFKVGDLNKNFNFHKKLNFSTKSLEKFFIFLKKKNCKNLVYTSTSLQKKKIITKYYRNDLNRLNYGWSKQILYLLIKFLCKKYSINLKNYFISQPYGPFEKNSSLSNYIYKNQKKVKLINPLRIIENNRIDYIAKNYAKFILGKKIKINYKTSTVAEFKKKFLSEIKNKKRSLFWNKYLNYCKKINENN